jgi:hypothetical protein
MEEEVGSMPRQTRFQSDWRGIWIVAATEARRLPGFRFTDRTEAASPMAGAWLGLGPPGGRSSARDESALADGVDVVATSSDSRKMTLRMLV